MADDTVPQIHCDHECVCWWYYEHKKSGTASPCESEKCHHRFQFGDGEIIHKNRGKVKFNSTDLLLLANDEWKRREERKHNHEEIPWVAGFINGFLTDWGWARSYLDKLYSPRHGGESPARQGCEGAVSEDSREEGDRQ